MPSYYSLDELRAGAGPLTASAAESRLGLFSKSASGPFDVFLSHSFLDARAVLGLREIFVAQGLRVYVDWIDDALLDRTKVSAATASLLRDRMKQSKSLVYATSRSAFASRWMPWELGFFDGSRGSARVSIIPVEGGSTSAFDGQEYLGLYKVVEKVKANGVLRPYAVDATGLQGEPMASFVNGRGEFVRLERS